MAKLAERFQFRGYWELVRNAAAADAFDRRLGL
jgi:hypothetical protein